MPRGREGDAWTRRREVLPLRPLSIPGNPIRSSPFPCQDLDAGLIPQWEKKALPEIAIKYWQLSPDATMRDLLLAVRADEVGWMLNEGRTRFLQ